MNDTLTPDEVARIRMIFCPTHSEVLYVAGMTTVEVAEWAGSHPCTLTVVFSDEPTLIPTERD